MQNKEEKKETTRRPAKTTTKALKGNKASSRKALPAAKSGATPIARLMAAASKAALPGITTSEKSSGTSKDARKKGGKSSGKGPSSSSKAGKATKSTKGKTSTKAKGKRTAKPANNKDAAAKKQTESSGGAAAAKAKGSNSPSTRRAAQEGGAAKASASKVGAGKKQASATKKAKKSSASTTTETKAKANGKTQSAAKAKTGAQNGTKAKAKSGDKVQGNVKANGGVKPKAGTKAKANGGTSAKANDNGETKAKASAKAKANDNGGSKAKANGGGVKSKANAKAKANGNAKANTGAKKAGPAHATPAIKRTPIETIRALPSTIGTKATEAKDWATQKGRTPLLIVVVSILVIYVIGSLVFSNIYLPGTTVNGDDASMRSADALTAQAQEASNNYKLNVSGDGANFSLAGSDIDFAFDVGAYERNAKSHLLGWAWPVGIFLPKDYLVLDGVSFNRDAVQSAVDSAIEPVNKNATAPKNATISYDAGKNSFVANKEQSGTAISSQNTMDAVCKGIGELRTQVDLGEAELQQPATKADSEQMGEAIRKANEISNREIALTVNGNTVKTVNAELIRPWLKVDDSYNVVADLDLVTDWAKSDLSREVDTAGTARTYTRTSDGKRINAIGGGSYGWNMNGAELAKIVCDHITSGSTESIEIPMITKGEVYVHGKQDWGPRYVDVDLAEQYVRMFDENSNIVMESSCVSGNLAENNETVTGVFYLEKKESPAILVGLDENGDGEPDYENEVQFWMPFYGGYGLHDALWRSYFGEDLYKYDGSHGCVNLPYYAAEQLYDLIRVGDPVVVHY
ncbi:MAG: L,D-transpeptidase family protein [Atopobiaceae bacterium]|nr:L,D-transpeptidase family protein [Atopobiaceae bacterium]